VPPLTGAVKGCKPGASKSASPCAKLIPQDAITSATAKMSGEASARFDSRTFMVPVSW
jgi:hypothetical protein